MSELSERLRERAEILRYQAECANDYYRTYQMRQQPWLREEQIKDRYDYAQSLSDCQDMEDAARKLEFDQKYIETLQAHLRFEVVSPVIDVDKPTISYNDYDLICAWCSDRKQRLVLTVCPIGEGHVCYQWLCTECWGNHEDEGE